ncbi:ABC transporter permease [bacterium]|nr:ABC transporter permease [bacterium]RQV98546.1 MAG: ABC transporter permease [bacterium]
MQRMLTMIRKEFRQIFRDRPMLVIIFIVPVIQLLIMSFAFTSEVKHISCLIVDFDNTPMSRDLIHSLHHTEQFDLTEMTTDIRQIDERMKRWQVQMALIIPPHFSRDLERHLNPQCQLIVDGVDGNTAGVALGYARGILSNFQEKWTAELTASSFHNDVHIIQMTERMLYNPDLRSQQFMVPGIVVILLTILPMMLSAMSLVKEKEVGTLEQLMVTPLKRYQLLSGKLIPFLLLSFFELFIVMSVGITVFKISMNGSYLLLACLALIYLMTTLGLGIFISTITHSQQQSMFVAWFSMIFLILMSGFFIPIENMPLLLQKLTYLNPMRYFMTIVRDIFQKGSSLRFLLKEAIPMTLFGLMIFTLSVFKFQKRVQ